MWRRFKSPIYRQPPYLATPPSPSFIFIPKPGFWQHSFWKHRPISTKLNFKWKTCWVKNITATKSIHNEKQGLPPSIGNHPYMDYSSVFKIKSWSPRLWLSMIFQKSQPLEIRRDSHYALLLLNIPQFRYLISEDIAFQIRVVTQPGNYMFKVNNRNTRTRCEICSKLTTKTPKRRQWRHISHFVVLFLLLTFSR